MSSAYDASLGQYEAEAELVRREDAAQNTLALLLAGVFWVTFVLTFLGGVHCHLHRVNTRRQAEARAKAPSTSASATLVAPNESASAEEIGDDEGAELAKRAAATLNAAQAAARRVRRTLEAAGNVLGIVSNFILIPIMFVLMFNGLPFGPVGFFVFTFGVMGVSGRNSKPLRGIRCSHLCSILNDQAVIQADPMQPRQFRVQPGMMLGPAPLLIGLFGALAMYVDPLAFLRRHPLLPPRGLRLLTGFFC